MLSDRDIIKAHQDSNIFLEPFNKNQVQPASYDVTLSNKFMVFDTHNLDLIDPRKSVQEHMKTIEIEDDGYFVLHPLQFAIGATSEKIGVNGAYSAQIEGKSSLARLGLLVHITAGFIDPGNNLNVTLEFFNANSVPIKLYPKMKIAQVKFWKLSSKCETEYGSPKLNSKYYGATGVQASQMHKNFLVKVK